MRHPYLLHRQNGTIGMHCLGQKWICMTVSMDLSRLLFICLSFNTSPYILAVFHRSSFSLSCSFSFSSALFSSPRLVPFCGVIFSLPFLLFTLFNSFPPLFFTLYVFVLFQFFFSSSCPFTLSPPFCYIFAIQNSVLYYATINLAYHLHSIIRPFACLTHHLYPSFSYLLGLPSITLSLKCVSCAPLFCPCVLASCLACLFFTLRDI